MEDRREEILEAHGLKPASSLHYDQDIVNFNLVKVAMDEYFKERALELLDFIARRTNNYVIENGVPEFLYKGEWITKEQLFENFL